MTVSPVGAVKGSGSSKSKHHAGSDEVKSTPKRKFNVARRRSDDGKKGKKDGVETGEFRRKNSRNMSKSMQSLEATDQQGIVNC